MGADKEDQDMAVKKEDLKDKEAQLKRKKMVREMTKEIIDRNEEGLRRLSKS